MNFSSTIARPERACRTFEPSQTAAVAIGDKLVGYGCPAYVIAEIGINHNGDLDLAKRLISVAHAAGCDAVKFQKRTVNIVYTASELAKPRESPFGETNGDLKRGSNSVWNSSTTSRPIAGRSRCPGSHPAGTPLRSTSSAGSTCPATRSPRPR